MLEVFMSKDKGRGLKCTSAIKRGTVVLTSEPFIHLLSSEQKGIRCDHCLSKQENLLRCSGCKFMRYCNKACQKGAWLQHKHECMALKRVSPKVPPDFVMLLGRVLWKLIFSDYEKLSDEGKEILGNYVVILHSYWGLGKLPLQVPDIRAVLELCAKLRNNSFAICDEELQSDVGTGIYLSCSLMNHSCVPNCTSTFDGLQLHIRTLRDLEEGEELTISYVDQLAPSEDRQEELQNIYRFTCTCPSCTNKTNDDKMLRGVTGEILSMNSSKIVAVKDFLEDLKKLQKTGKFDEVRELAGGYVSRNVLPTRNVYMARVHDFATDAAIMTERFEEAFAHGVLALKTYQDYLPEIHPLTGIQMMKLGKILLFLCRNLEAIRMLLEALKILQITHSHKGEVMQELRVLIEQCQLEIREESKMRESSKRQSSTAQ